MNRSYSICFFLFFISHFGQAQIGLAPDVLNLLESDTTILGVRYIDKRYSNGSFKERGWVYATYYWPYPPRNHYDTEILMRIGEWRTFRSNGSLKLKEAISLNHADYDTICHYNRKGILFKKLIYRPIDNPYRLGEKSETFRMSISKFYVLDYHPNGQLKRHVFFNSIHYHGDCSAYYEDGTLLYKKYYNDKGKLEGPYQEFHENGKEKVSGNFVNGKESGRWTWYNQVGIVEKEKTFGKLP